MSDAQSDKHTPEQTGKRTAPRSAWKPGQSGNPQGRPRSPNSLAELLRKYLDRKEGGRARKHLLVARLYTEATTGANVVAAVRLVFEIVGTLDIEARLTSLEELYHGSRQADETSHPTVTTERAPRAHQRHQGTRRPGGGDCVQGLSAGRNPPPLTEKQRRARENFKIKSGDKFIIIGSDGKRRVQVVP